MRPITKGKVFRKGQARHALRDDGFETLHRFLVRRSADVAGAVIMIISEHAADLAVQLDACRPITLMPALFSILLDLGERPLLISQVDELLNLLRIQDLPVVLRLFYFLLQRLKLFPKVFESGIRRQWRQRLAEIGVNPCRCNRPDSALPARFRHPVPPTRPR